MGYVMKENLANKQNYGGSRNTSNIKYLVYHYTANDGDSDEANGNYFHNNVVKASAHYFVDNNSVTRTVPDNYVAYSVGKNFGSNNLFGVCTNANSLNIEICDEVRNGIYDFSEATLSNAVELGKKLMKQYNIPIERVVRHYDVCTKICPKPFVDNYNAWINFKNRLTSTTTPTEKVIDEGSNTNYLVKVLVDVLNVRTGPSTDFGVATSIHKNEVYTIVKETINQYGSKWGKLKSGAGWISLNSKYVTTNISTTSTPTYSYYPPCDKNCKSIVDGLNSIGVDSSFSNRKKIAQKNNIKDYSGSATQNNQMLAKLKAGRLIK